MTLPAGRNPWTTRASRVVYENPWITVREDDVVRPDGGDGIYGVITTRVATGVVAMTDDDRVVLVNDTPDVVAGTLEWTAGVESGTHPFEIGPLTHESIDDIDVLPDARVELTVSLDDRASDELP